MSGKRVAITGDRHWKSDRYGILLRSLQTLDPEHDYVVLGDARGVDTLALQACKSLHLRYGKHDAKWRLNGVYRPGAGPERNGWMLDDLTKGPLEAEREVWYFHDDLGNSRGTKNCVKQARERNITVINGQKVGLQ